MSQEKICPNCSSLSTGNFCPKCGQSLNLSEVDVFKKRKEEIRHNFVYRDCKEIIGNAIAGYELGCAAWHIATKTPANYELLQGEQMGTPESYDELDEAMRQALNIVKLLKDFRDCYNSEGGFEMTRVQNATMIVWGK